MKTLITHGTIVTASDQYNGDVLVEDEKIIVIGTRLDIQAVSYTHLTLPTTRG